MGKYTNQAITYQNNVQKIIDILKSTKIGIENIEKKVLVHSSKVDYMTTRIRDQNKNLKTEINEIISILNSNVPKLLNEGKKIDRRIEEEERIRKQHELEENNSEKE